MARDYVKLYAPYVFLAEGAAGVSKFDLFVCIPYRIGETVTQTNLTYTNGKTFLQFSITGTATPAMTSSRFFKRVALNPDQAATSGNYNFDPARFCVEVSTSFQQVTHTIQVFYRDANPEELPSEQVAFDSPYLYLVNPHEVNGSEIYEYIPYCLVPLKNFDQGDPLAYKYSEDEDAGECLQEIVLSSLLPNTPPVGNTTNPNGVESVNIANYREVTVRSMRVNEEVYRDARRTEGWFETTIIYPEAGGKKRKGKLTNASSDPNSTSFIDSFF